MLFLPFVLPICLWVAYSDMSRMKIPNYAVLALIAVFVVLGPFMFELNSYFWRLGGGVIVLAIGFAMNQLGLIGAGDAKFAAAMAPFFALEHVFPVMMLFSVVLIVSFIGHRIARNLKFITNMTPDWKSWTDRRFPMGLSLAITLMIYVVQVALNN